jgi:hypothetical protein
MQAGRAYKQVLETPEKALEIHDEVNAPIDCSWYYRDEAQYFNEPILIHENINKKIFNIVFNTEDRNNIYWQYDKLLSGGSYTLLDGKEMKEKCDFNTTKYEK